jgi:hypothetical protein
MAAAGESSCIERSASASQHLKARRGGRRNVAAKWRQLALGIWRGEAWRRLKASIINGGNGGISEISAKAINGAKAKASGGERRGIGENA